MGIQDQRLLKKSAWIYLQQIIDFHIVVQHALQHKTAYLHCKSKTRTIHGVICSCLFQNRLRKKILMDYLFDSINATLHSTMCKVYF